MCCSAHRRSSLHSSAGCVRSLYVAASTHRALGPVCVLPSPSVVLSPQPPYRDALLQAEEQRCGRLQTHVHVKLEEDLRELSLLVADNMSPPSASNLPPHYLECRPVPRNATTAAWAIMRSVRSVCVCAQAPLPLPHPTHYVAARGALPVAVAHRAAIFPRAANAAHWRSGHHRHHGLHLSRSRGDGSAGSPSATARRPGPTAAAVAAAAAACALPSSMRVELRDR